MKNNRMYPVLLIVMFFITACATTPKFAVMDEVIATGGEIVNYRDLIGEAGVTFVSTDGAWFNYLGVDGRKVVKITKTGLIKELTWRFNEADQFCQQMFGTEKEECDNLVLYKDIEGIYSSHNKINNKLGFPFTIASGNPENF